MDINNTCCTNTPNCSCNTGNHCCHGVKIAGCGNPIYNVFTWNRHCHHYCQPEQCAIDMLYEYLPKEEAAELYINNRDLYNLQDAIADTYETKQHAYEVELNLWNAINTIEHPEATPTDPNASVAGLDKLPQIVGESLADYALGVYAGQRRSLVNMTAKLNELEENKIDTITVNGGSKIYPDLAGNVDILITLPQNQFALGYASSTTKYAVEADEQSKLYVNIGQALNPVYQNLYSIEQDVVSLSDRVDGINPLSQDALNDYVTNNKLAKIINGREVPADIDTYATNVGGGHQLSLNQIELVVQSIKDQSSWDSKVDDAISRLIDDGNTELGSYIYRYLQPKFTGPTAVNQYLKKINGQSLYGSGNIDTTADCILTIKINGNVQLLTRVDGKNLVNIAADTTATENSTNLVTSNAVYNVLETAQDAWVYADQDRDTISLIECALGGNSSIMNVDDNTMVDTNSRIAGYGYDVKNNLNNAVSVLDRLTDLESALSAKLNTVSLKTINGQSLVWSPGESTDITISGGSNSSSSGSSITKIASNLYNYVSYRHGDEIFFTDKNETVWVDNNGDLRYADGIYAYDKYHTDVNAKYGSTNPSTTYSTPGQLFYNTTEDKLKVYYPGPGWSDAVTGFVKTISVNGGSTTTPDSNGNVDVTIGEGGSAYVLPQAQSGTLGGIKTGYTTDSTNGNYKVLTDSNGNAYVNVPASSGGGATSLMQLTDVALTNPITAATYLKYDGTYWIAEDIALGDLSNVLITSLNGDDILKYNGTSHDWENVQIGTFFKSTLDVSGPHGVANRTITKYLQPLYELVCGTVAGNGSVENDSTKDSALTAMENYVTSARNGASSVGSNNLYLQVQSLKSRTINDLSNVLINTSTLSNGQVLKYNGSKWVNGTDNSGSSITVDSSLNTSSTHAIQNGVVATAILNLKPTISTDFNSNRSSYPAAAFDGRFLFVLEASTVRGLIFSYNGYWYSCADGSIV